MDLHLVVMDGVSSSSLILTTTIRNVIIDGTSFLADSEEEGEDNFQIRGRQLFDGSMDAAEDMWEEDSLVMGMEEGDMSIGTNDTNGTNYTQTNISDMSM
jgi:hypothetical protein